MIVVIEMFFIVPSLTNIEKENVKERVKQMEGK